MLHSQRPNLKEIGIVHVHTKIQTHRCLIHPPRPGATNISGALRVVQDEVLRESKGNRPGVEDVVILFSDGVSDLDEDKVEADLEQLAEVSVNLILKISRCLLDCCLANRLN